MKENLENYNPVHFFEHSEIFWGYMYVNVKSVYLAGLLPEVYIHDSEGIHSYAQTPVLMLLS